MLNLISLPQPITWPLAGFGGNTIGGRSTFAIVFDVTMQLDLTFYV
jgi:hypothetical protein